IGTSAAWCRTLDSASGPDCSSPRTTRCRAGTPATSSRPRDSRRLPRSTAADRTSRTRFVAVALVDDRYSMLAGVGLRNEQRVRRAHPLSVDDGLAAPAASIAARLIAEVL